MIIYLSLPKYLYEWCLHDWGDAQGIVRFPRGSAENDVLEMMLDKLGEGDTLVLAQSRYNCYLEDISADGKKLLVSSPDSCSILVIIGLKISVS